MCLLGKTAPFCVVLLCLAVFRNMILMLNEDTMTIFVPFSDFGGVGICKNEHFLE